MKLLLATVLLLAVHIQETHSSRQLLVDQYAWKSSDSVAISHGHAIIMAEAEEQRESPLTPPAPRPNERPQRAKPIIRARAPPPPVSPSP
ncbi:hypothetical protein ACLOJK_019408 [Asimina triloba]